MGFCATRRVPTQKGGRLRIERSRSVEPNAKSPGWETHWRRAVVRLSFSSGVSVMKFHSKPIEEHAEVPLADEGRLEELVTHWTQREAPARPALASGNRCY